MFTTILFAFAGFTAFVQCKETFDVMQRATMEALKDRAMEMASDPKLKSSFEELTADLYKELEQNDLVNDIENLQQKYVDSNENFDMKDALPVIEKVLPILKDVDMSKLDVNGNLQEVLKSEKFEEAMKSLDWDKLVENIDFQEMANKPEIQELLKDPELQNVLAGMVEKEALDDSNDDMAIKSFMSQFNKNVLNIPSDPSLVKSNRKKSGEQILADHQARERDLTRKYKSRNNFRSNMRANNMKIFQKKAKFAKEKHAKKDGNVANRQKNAMKSKGFFERRKLKQKYLRERKELKIALDEELKQLEQGAALQDLQDDKAFSKHLDELNAARAQNSREIVKISADLRNIRNKRRQLFGRRGR